MKKLLTTLIVIISLSTVAFSQTGNTGNNNSFMSTPDTSHANPFNFGSMFQSMGPMYKTMLSSMMEGMLEYYEKPGTVDRVAAVNHKYFEALKNAGFTEEQAMKIITSSPIGSTMPSAK